MAADYLDLLRQALAADAHTRAALQTTLAPLRAYDREHGGDLVHTLAVYFAEGENLSRAAVALFLHRNSLYYRLAHIEALTGLTLADEMHRLWLHLAVVLASSLESAESTEPRNPP